MIGIAGPLQHRVGTLHLYHWFLSFFHLFFPARRTDNKRLSCALSRDHHGVSRLPVPPYSLRGRGC